MLSGLKILIVDDDEEILDLLAEYLKAKGNSVEKRTNTREGLHVLRDGDVDLLITDIVMDESEMNGAEFLRIARSNYPDLGIVVITAYGDRFSLSACLEAGADGYLSKPFSLKKFSLILEREYWKAVSRQDWWERLSKKQSG